MRKIEQAMVDAIRLQRPFKSANTEVAIQYSDGQVAFIRVLLHGNEIASFTPFSKDCPMLSHCGWPTATTTSRLHAIIGALSNHECAAYREKGELKVGKRIPQPHKESRYGMVPCAMVPRAIITGQPQPVPLR